MEIFISDLHRKVYVGGGMCVEVKGRIWKTLVIKLLEYLSSIMYYEMQNVNYQNSQLETRSSLSLGKCTA